jgi:hypothetical protein
MRRTLLLLSLLILWPAGGATAAEIGISRYTGVAGGPVYVLPFPRSERAQSIWMETACWEDCGRTCAWGLTECLYRDAQGTCLRITDRCDRHCQRQCRIQGGPFLPISD